MVVIRHGLIGQNVQRLAVVGCRNELEHVQIRLQRMEEVTVKVSEVRKRARDVKHRVVQVCTLIAKNFGLINFGPTNFGHNVSDKTRKNEFGKGRDLSK